MDVALFNSCSYMQSMSDQPCEAHAWRWTAAHTPGLAAFLECDLLELRNGKVIHSPELGSSAAHVSHTPEQ